MNKKDKQSWVTDWLTNNKPRLMDLKCSENTIDKMYNDILREEILATYIDEIYKYIKDDLVLILHQLDEVVELVPKKRWKDYETYNITNLREQNMRIDAERNVVRMWRKRPIFKKADHVKKNAKNDKKD